jgi:hypothetical protein
MTYSTILPFVVGACLILWLVRLAYAIIKWKAYIWLPSQLFNHRKKSRVPDRAKHLIFTMVDHYEPGRGLSGVEKNHRWLESFRKISNAHLDCHGNRFRYTWFYPFDHENEKVMAALSKMAYDGHGEVEFHWHHPIADNQSYPAMVEEALDWFAQFGAMISDEPQPRSHFAFIHGNWALDNSLPICGVDHELDILYRHGCYADFTFSTIGTFAQPRKTNSLYYPAKRIGPKSYVNGTDVAVGVPVHDRAMIFQGPIGFDWLTGKFEYGAVESFALPSKKRIRKWIDAGIHVSGRPEWIFVKVYSHGDQSANEIVHRTLGTMLDDLENTCQNRGIRLHYMTAREAFNVAKAAEAGKSGDPGDYRDFRIPKPRNMTTPFGDSQTEITIKEQDHAYAAGATT